MFKLPAFPSIKLYRKNIKSIEERLSRGSDIRYATNSTLIEDLSTLFNKDSIAEGAEETFMYTVAESKLNNSIIILDLNAKV
jgi:hypothetical protein